MIKTYLIVMVAVMVSGFAFSATAEPEWEEAGCGTVKEDLKLSPENLMREFVRRDRDGEFLETSPWLNRAVVCPEHMGGPDTANVATSWSIRSTGPREFSVTYQLEGEITTAAAAAIFKPKRESLKENYRIVKTAWGWKLASPWNFSKLSPETAIKRFRDPRMRLDPVSEKALGALRAKKMDKTSR